MKVFVDTSAFIALSDDTDRNHRQAQQIWARLARSKDATLFCTSYVLSETAALIQNRFGVGALRLFQENVFPFLQVMWVDEALHDVGMTAVLAANRRRLSLVDCVSFAAARQFGVKTVFAFDAHFVEQGFSGLRS